jgi:hypothetical protein
LYSGDITPDTERFLSTSPATQQAVTRLRAQQRLPSNGQCQPYCDAESEH